MRDALAVVPLAVALLLGPPAARGQGAPDRDRVKDPGANARHGPVPIPGRRGDRFLTFDEADPRALRRDEDELAHPLRRPAPPVMRPDGGDVPLSSDNFDRWLFGDGMDGERCLLHLARALEAKLDGAAREHRLGDAERAKLHLAGRGDIKRFLARTEVERMAFEGSRRTTAGGLDALRRLEPLSREFWRGPFEDDSLFDKVLAKILADREATGRSRP